MKSVALLVLGGAVAVFAGAPAMADLKAGNDAWQRGDASAAIAEWRPLAIAGDPEAQFHMGEAYQLGRGVPIDLKLAEDWFRRAADAGSLDGKDSYGLVLFQKGKRAEALPYIEDAAGRGNARAQYILGTALFNGDMIAKDWPRAYAMMLRASAAGIPAANASLAQMDKFIPLDQRDRGRALAGAFEAHASKQEVRSIEPTPRSHIRTEELPPSTPVIAKSESRPSGNVPLATPAKPVRVAAAPKPVVPKPIAKPAPTPIAAPAPAPGGKWRIQLGAFSDAATAHVIWPGMRVRIPVLGGYHAFAVKAGAVTRLQAGPLASYASASQLCAAVRAAKQPCVPVAP